MILAKNAAAQSMTALEIAVVCGGVQSISAEGDSATINANGRNFRIEGAQGDLAVFEGGVKIASIKTFTQKDYNQCVLDLTKATRGVSSEEKKVQYDWKKDAERLAYIYEGNADCVGKDSLKNAVQYGRANVMSDKCWHVKVGDYKLDNGEMEFANDLTVTKTTIGIRNREWVGEKQNHDIYAEANLSDLKVHAYHTRGGYYDKTPSRSLSVECVAGNCIRWTGWMYYAQGPGKPPKREVFKDKPVMPEFDIPVFPKHIDDSLVMEMRTILARLISPEHSSTGKVACQILCGKDLCSYMSDTKECEEEIQKEMEYK